MNIILNIDQILLLMKIRTAVLHFTYIHAEFVFKRKKNLIQLKLKNREGELMMHLISTTSNNRNNNQTQK